MGFNNPALLGATEEYLREKRRRNIMKRYIWKYLIPTADKVTLRMPKFAEVIHIAEQGGILALWAIVNPDLEEEERIFYVVGTGHPLPHAKYIGTVLIDPFVWHIFESKMD